MTNQIKQDDIIPNGEEIVERFGGIRPMATKLSVPVTTVQGWKKRDAIPANRRDEIISAAADHDVNVTDLLADTAANENASAKPSVGTIAEDPALRKQTDNPSKLSQKTPRQAMMSEHDFIDLKSVKRTARTTSILTSVAMVAVLGAAGFFLFGQNVNIPGTTMTDNPSERLNAVESRITDIEGQIFSTPGNVGVAQLGNIQATLNNLTSAIGLSGPELQRFVQSVAAGSGAPITQRLAVLEQQISQSLGGNNPGLSAMVQRMEDVVGTNGDPAQNPTNPMDALANAGQWQEAIADLRTIVSSVQGRMDGFDTALQEAKNDNDALGDMLAEVSGRDLSAAAMLLALSQLRESIDRQTPFADDLALMRNIAENTDPQLAESIDRMTPYAESGVMSSDGLKRELQGLSNDIINAKVQGEELNLSDKIQSRIKGLFSIKKDGVSLTGDDTERALVEQASAQLDSGDVRGAIATLQKLEGPAATAAQPWQQQAAANLAARELDAQLVNAILGKVKNIAGGSRVINLTPAAPVQQTPTPAPSVPAPTPDIIQQ